MAVIEHRHPMDSFDNIVKSFEKELDDEIIEVINYVRNYIIYTIKPNNRYNLGETVPILHWLCIPSIYRGTDAFLCECLYVDVRVQPKVLEVVREKLKEKGYV